MRALLSPLLVLAAVSLAQPALAQQRGPLDTSNIHMATPKPKTGERSEPPPPAVPGARARPDSVTPAERGAADLPPTEALFDAINRGDIATARDAISRGADLDATNLLGLKPTELSVDLGRNDITFLLLSLRGSTGGQRGAPVQTADAPPSPASERRKARAASRIPAGPADPTAMAVPVAASPRAPTLFAGNGGAAVPSVGFLGFDPHR